MLWVLIRSASDPKFPQTDSQDSGDQGAGMGRLIWVFVKWPYLKGSIFLKNRYFIIQERFNKLIYIINTIIKCDIWQPVKFQLISSSSNEMMFVYLLSEYMLPTLIQRNDKKNHFIFYAVQNRGTTCNWNFTGCQTPHFMIVLQSSQRSTLPPERPMNGERPERNRDRTGTGTTGTERPSVPFLAFLAFPVVPVHSSEKMERCLLKLSCYQTKRNLTFKTIQSDHSSRSNIYSKTVLS